MDNDLDAVRAIILARTDQLRLSLAEVSKKIGCNPAYLQQFLRRGIPRVLPEDKREALAAVLGVAPQALRGAGVSRGGPQPVSPDAVAQTAEEVEILRIFRGMDQVAQRKALGALRALA